MISLHTNTAAATTISTINKSNEALTSSMERLSTGYRINSAADDSAGLQIASRLETQSRGMGVASRNAQDAMSMLQTGEGAFAEIGDIGSRMNDLATQAANGTNSTADLEALDKEYQALGEEMASILSNTKYGGQAILSGGAGLDAAKTFQIGASTSETLTVDLTTNSKLGDVASFVGKSGSLGVGSLLTQTDAKTAMDAISGNAGFLEDVTATRSEIGSNINRLEHTVSNMSQMQENVDAATGRIMDVDFATESGNMTKNQMLVQTGAQMLSSTKSMTQMAAQMLG